MQIIKGIPPKLPLNTYVAIDSEWLGMKEETLHRPTSGKFALLTACYKPGEVWYVDDPLLVPVMLDELKDAVWIIQNAKFDLMQLRRLAFIPPRTKLVDTEMIERLLWSGYYDRFNEQAMARRYLGEYLDKTLQKAWSTATDVTPEMLEYACKDSETLLRIWYEQKKLIKQSDMEVYKKVDLSALWAVLDFQGFRVDAERWLELSQHHRQLSDEIDAGLPVNPRSPKQVVSWLREHGFKKIKDSAESTIQEAIKKFPNTESAEVATRILDSRGYRKLSSTYGQGMLDAHSETLPDGSVCFFGDFHIIGAATGRMSCSSPNIQNIPVRETKVFRECFIPKPGNKLIIADYSQQEIFIMAYLSQDPTLIEICNSGRDVYIEVAKSIYDLNITKKDPLRADMKSLILGTDYGMTKYGLSRRTNKTLDEAEKLINDFFRTFPGVKRWMDEQDRINTYTTTVMGRRAWLNPYTNRSQRNGYNNPIQGTAADIMKMSVGAMHKNWKFDCPFGLVAIVHDEAVADVPERFAPDVAEYIRYYMEDTANEMLPGMKFRADVVINDSWVKE